MVCQPIDEKTKMDATENYNRIGPSVRISVFLPILAMALAGGFSFSAAGQEILKLEFSKPAPEEIGRPRTFLEIHLLMDLDKLDVGNPFDDERSSLELMQDDQGHDLLAMHNEIKARSSVTTPSGGRRAFSKPPPTLRFGGVADESNNENILLRVSVLAVPSLGATRVRLAGRAVLNFISEAVPSELQIDEISLDTESFSDQRIDSEIGPILISPGRHLYAGSNELREFSVHGLEKPILGVEVIGGDDSDGFPLIISGDFALGKPRTVSLRLRYGEYEKREVPLDLDFSIGM